MTARFDFKCRTRTAYYTPAMVKEINAQLDHLCTLRFTQEELDYIANIPYHKGQLGFLEFLRNFSLNRNYIHCEVDRSEHCGMKIYTDEASILATSMFEIFVLIISQEVYYRFTFNDCWSELIAEGKRRFDKKLERLKQNPIKWSEFGCRRRICYEMEDYVVKNLVGTPGFAGTSNIHFAMKYGVKPIGTFAHELMMAMQRSPQCRIEDSQWYAFDSWTREFNGDNGTCLSDCLGYNRFKIDFNPLLARTFTGTRHDSGDPIAYGLMMIDIYEKLNLNPLNYNICYSDSLDLDKMYFIRDYFKGMRAPDSVFGCGTYFTNDCGVTALNVVMKMTSCNGRPVAKLSADAGKTMCKDDEYVELLLKLTNWEAAPKSEAWTNFLAKWQPAPLIPEYMKYVKTREQYDEEEYAEAA
jgi:nicotinate phosphoribosyltransferase